MAFLTPLLFFIVCISFLTSVSPLPLDKIFPTIAQEFYSFAPTKEGYRYSLDLPNGSKRYEMGVFLNADTPEQELVLMGTYTAYDEKIDTETITMYTADKDGYRPRYQIKNRKLSASALKGSVG